MKMPALSKKSDKKRTRTGSRSRAKVSQPIVVGRASPVEFSCGVDLDRALLVAESLDERERRG